MTSSPVARTVAVAVVAIFVTYLPITAVSVSLTTIGGATGASTAGLQWVTVSYIIPVAAVILSAGVFGDLHGRRRVFLIGMALTAAGTAIAAASATAGSAALGILCAGQVVTGVGGGLIVPTTLGLIAHAVPEPARRARFVAMWATGLVGGLTVGPLASGVILRYAGWGWIFTPVTVLAVGTAALAARWLPESRSPTGRHLDWPGQIFASVAIAASIFGVIEGGQAGWGSPRAVLGLVAGAAALAGFLRVETRSTSPLLNLALFRSPAFSAAGVAALVALFALVGTIFLLSLFFGAGQHLSPLQIAVRLLFLNGVTVVAGPFVGRLLGRWSPVGLLAFGLALGAIAMLCLTGLRAGAGIGDAAWRLAVLGVADAFMLSAVAVAAIHRVPHDLAAMAAAGNTALRQYGGTLGPAVLGAVLTTRMGSGASMVDALHTALALNAGLLLAAALGCALAARLDRQRVATSNT
ncbi:MFS transporter [Asanoa ishikariensis]|uniref:Major Facilitator Superfamily protein n=1 Tax=Asanoa ishikariensis TaxID=137265 RepID=A0A1H3TLV9_9ACTN|nr:MFS transporter [Asanoa ishikariensis]GIF62150.1 MFS transporter [Asanoa ishikariensis]SDZ51272.1 Major Facilitator Superfamily protein [Asanoa ishikariensis]